MNITNTLLIVKDLVNKIYIWYLDLIYVGCLMNDVGLIDLDFSNSKSFQYILESLGLNFSLINNYKQQMQYV